MEKKAAKEAMSLWIPVFATFFPFLTGSGKNASCGYLVTCRVVRQHVLSVA